jgi:16S rRNA (cytosine1402-N4)-methyltransferase
MLNEVLEQLDIQKGELVVDATAGSGGHSEAALKAGARLLALDADMAAVERTRERLVPYGVRAEVVEANFKDLGKVLKHAGINTIDKVIFDLGWNREQLAAGKGFSFLIDEPLNMSYGAKPASGFTASEIVNEWKEEVIADVLYGYGEETYARRIAKAIVERRAIKPIETTIELSEIIKDAVPAAYRKARLHPATRSFQALRMAVNAEIACIESGITAAWEHLSEGGRIAVITFHSIEDRAVKKLFQNLVDKDKGAFVNPDASGSGPRLKRRGKPLVPSRAEISQNPSARSAKLRVIEKKYEKDN